MVAGHPDSSRRLVSGYAGLAAACAVACGTDEPLLPADATAGTERGTASLVFVGDIMFDGAVRDDLAIRGYGPDAALEPTRSIIESADFAACNLETAVTPAGEPIDKRYTFNSDVEALAALADAGFDLVTLANNHVLDFGPGGLDDTRQHLAATGLAWCGISAGDAPQVPYTTVIEGVKIGVLGYADPETPTAYAPEFFAFDERPAGAGEAAIARDLDALVPRVDLVIVEVHWGIEGAPVTPRQRALGQFMIDHGADIVVGHHPHVVQEIERYGSGLILHSLGHFIAEFSADPAQMEAALVRVEVTRQGIGRAELLLLDLYLHEWTPVPRRTGFEIIP